MKDLIGTLLLGFVAACGATAPAPRPAEPAPPAAVGANASEPATAPEPEPEPVAWEGAAELASNAGHYVLRYRTAPDPIPWGDPFELNVWVLDAGGEPVQGVSLSVDAAMPEHGHGMNRVPMVSAAEHGGFGVGGMLFHMPGRWELYFDVTRGALTERAQIDVELE